MVWISVIDGLPKKQQDYLCVTEWYGRQSIRVLTYFFKNPDHYGERINNSFWDYDSEYGYYKINDITHWCELPKLPDKKSS